MRIDLHTHSNRSDGTDSPRDLVRNAAAAGLDVIGLVDHDVAAGWDEALAAGEEFGVRVVCGMEVSTEVDGTSVHLLAYEPDPNHAELSAELAKVLESRENRIPLIVAGLAGSGIDVTVEQVLAQAGSAASVGRPHVADAMVAAGHVADRDEAFTNWLAHGKPGHVRKYDIDLRKAVGLVVAAGGVPVIAHPWARESAELMTEEFLAELAAIGLKGIEVDHPDHDEAQRVELRGIAERLGLVVTGSSDHHGTGKGPEFSLGVNLTAPEELERLLG